MLPSNFTSCGGRKLAIIAHDHSSVCMHYVHGHGVHLSHEQGRYPKNASICMHWERLSRLVDSGTQMSRAECLTLSKLAICRKIGIYIVSCIVSTPAICMAQNGNRPVLMALKNASTFGVCITHTAPAVTPDSFDVVPAHTVTPISLNQVWISVLIYIARSMPA